MNSKTPKGLGKGLGSLLGESAVEAVETEDNSSVVQTHTNDKQGVSLIRTVDIEPNPLQPRHDFDEEHLNELADSIAKHGIIQPLAVRKMGNGVYQIIAGERRWRAARMAGLKELPVIVLEADELRAMELAMIENLQREDLNPVEEAEGYLALISQYGLTQEEVAEKVGRSRPVIANAMRLLALDTTILDMLISGVITPGHARALLPLTSAAEQNTIAERIAEYGLSVRQVETLVKKMQEAEDENQFPSEESAQKSLTVNYIEVLQKDLGDRLGRKIKIINGKNKGRVEIEYYGNDDLNRLADYLTGMRS